MRTFLLLPILLWGQLSFGQRHELKVEFTVPNELNYGGEITFRFLQLDKKGRAKPMTSVHKNGFTIDVENGYFTFDEQSRDLQGKLTVAPYPENWFDTVIQVKLNYVHTPMFSNDTYEKTETYQFTLNFKGDLRLNYSGDIGGKGRVGQNKRLFGALFLRGGKEGEKGETGQRGSNLQIRTVIEYFGLDSTVIFEAYDDRDSVLSRYKLGQLHQRIHVDVSGGRGDEGGAGQRGSNTNASLKDGGRGGDGGDGGRGGQLTCFLHPHLHFLQHNFLVKYEGGHSGTPGQGGAGGQSRKNAEKEFKGVKGPDGNPGTPGVIGLPPVFISKTVTQLPH